MCIHEVKHMLIKRLLFSLTLALLLLLLVAPAFAQDSCADIAGCDDFSGVPQTVLDAYPQPNVTPLVIDDSQLYDRIYRRVSAGMQIYDAPGGNLISTTGGFSFVTVKEVQGDWTRIDAAQWVLSSQLTDNVLVSRFAGVELPAEGLDYPMAWTLRHLRPAASPGADESPNNPFLYRFTRVTLYTYVEIDGYRWYQIGATQWVHQFDVSKLTPIERPEEVETEKWIGIDLYEQSLIAYEGETPVFATLISSGLSGWDTPEGLYYIWLRYERTTMSGAYQQPDFYSLQEVPWTMYFNGDIALHGTYWHEGFGYRASHGCVNASITDARWLYEWAYDEWDWDEGHGIAIYVYSSGQYAEQ